MNIVLIGPPGSGKGSQAKLLEKAFELPHLSTGNMFRKMMHEDSELGKKVYGYMSKAQLVPDEVSIEVVQTHLQEPQYKNGFMLDGYPRTLNQAEQLDKVLNIDIAILLDTSLEVVASRVLKRRICPNCNEVYSLISYEGEVCSACGTPLAMRKDDNITTITNRFLEYEAQTKPVVEYYKQKGKLYEIDANETIEQIFEKIRQRLNDQKGK